MINTLVRQADLTDRQQLSNLIFFETRVHRHLDWRPPLEWLGDPFYWALDEGGLISAALACPLETSGIAWVRLFVYTARWSAENAWKALWTNARDEMAQAGGAKVAAIATHSWFQDILETNGFENPQQIVMLEWRGFVSQPLTAPLTGGARIRRMVEDDLPAVAETDAASFEPLWQNSLDTLRRAYSQSLYATVAEDENGVIGYQLSTGNGQRAHLARLAVHSQVQGRGIGRAMLNDLFAYLTYAGIPRLSVNTQSDNQISLNLYQHMGFARTGEQYPVYTFEVG